MTFRNPILGAGGSTLLRPAIQSPNFVHGVSGWFIGRGGDAEFNEVTIRNGESVSGTDLHYSGTPAAGNLVASVASTDGTDPYGNPYLAGVCAYDPTNGIFAQLQSGILTFGTMTGTTPNTTTAAALNVDASNGVLDIFSSSNAAGGFPNRALLEIVAGTAGATVPNGSEPYLNVQDPAQSSVVSMFLSGALVKSTVGGTPETWHTPSPLGSGWALGPSGGTVQPLQYRIDGMDNLVLDGTVHTTSTAPAATIFTLPDGYRPLKTRRSPGVSNSGGTATARYAQITSTGAVSINANITTASTDVYFEVSVPRGNIA